MDFLFNSIEVNFLLKTNGLRNRKSSFLIFVAWNALIVSSWVVRPAEISSFVFLF